MEESRSKEIRITEKSAPVAGFSGALFLLFALFFVVCIVSALIAGECFFIGSPLFFGDVSDVFMDFFNVNAFVEDMDPYIANGSSYPPFVLIIAKFFNLFADYSSSGRAARSSFAGVISIIVFYAAFFIPAYFILYKALTKNGFRLRHVNLIFTAFLLSGPFLYGFFRGNYIFYSLLTAAVFFMYYRDERPLIRELSYVALAVSVGIKLYPAVFALILIREKKWKDFFRVVLYCTVFVIVPFFFFKGGFWVNFKSFITNLQVFTNQPYKFYSSIAVYTNFYSYGVSAANFVRVIYCAVTNTSLIECPDYINTIGVAFNLAVMTVIVFSAMVTPSRWKHAAAMTLVQILFPDPSYVYSVIFMFIPIVMFIVDKNKKRGGDVGYMLLFIIIMSPLQPGYVIAPFTKGLQYGYTVSNFLQTCAMLVLGGALFADGVKSLKKVPAKEAALKEERENNGLGFCGALLFWAAVVRKIAERAASAVVRFAYKAKDKILSLIKSPRENKNRKTEKRRRANPFLIAMIVNLALTAVIVVAGINVCGIVFGSVENFFDEMVYSYAISDFGQTIYFAMSKNPYVGDFTTSYAPLGFLFLKPFAALCSLNEAFSTPLSFEDITSYNKAIIVTPHFWACYVIYVIGCVLAIYFLLRKTTSLGNKNAAFFFAAVVFSDIFIYGIARGTNVLLTFVFVAAFIRFKDSPNKVLREISYICLAVAGVMKIYPLLFGVYLVRDKKIAAIVRTAVYTAVLFIVPFAFLDGGFMNVGVMINNLFVFTSKESRIFAPKNLSAASLLAKFLTLFSSQEKIEPLMNVLQYIPALAVFVVCVVNALRVKNPFSVSVFIMCGMTLVPTVSYFYLAIFTTLPLIEFIKCNKTMPKYKRIYYFAFFVVTSFVGFAVLKDFTLISVYYVATLIFETVCANKENKKLKSSEKLIKRTEGV